MKHFDLIRRTLAEIILNVVMTPGGGPLSFSYKTAEKHFIRFAEYEKWAIEKIRDFNHKIAELSFSCFEHETIYDLANGLECDLFLELFPMFDSDKDIAIFESIQYELFMNRIVYSGETVRTRLIFVEIAIGMQALNLPPYVALLVINNLEDFVQIDEDFPFYDSEKIKMIHRIVDSFSLLKEKQIKQ